MWRDAAARGWFDEWASLLSGAGVKQPQSASPSAGCRVNEAFARGCPVEQPIGRTHVDFDTGPRYEMVGVGTDASTRRATACGAYLLGQTGPAGSGTPRRPDRRGGAPGNVGWSRNTSQATARADRNVVFTSRTFNRMNRHQTANAGSGSFQSLSGFFGALALLQLGLLRRRRAPRERASDGESGCAWRSARRRRASPRLVFFRRCWRPHRSGTPALGLADKSLAARFIGPLLFKVASRESDDVRGHCRCWFPSACSLRQVCPQGAQGAGLDPATELLQG